MISNKTNALQEKVKFLLTASIPEQIETQFKLNVIQANGQQSTVVPISMTNFVDLIK